MPNDGCIRTEWAEGIPPPGQLPITREEVLSAERLWGGPDPPAWESQWAAIETIVADIWSTSSSDTDRLRRLWVMLTYAVGNFKRQGNTVISPLPAPWRLASLPGHSQPRRTLSIPVNGGILTLNSNGTTENLAGMTRGLSSVPTGSALLAALWPGEHAILDIRDFQATVGLLAFGCASVVRPQEARSLCAPDWNEYRWFRPLMKAETARLELPSLLTLERALFVAYDYGPRGAHDMTWARWGEELKDRWPVD